MESRVAANALVVEHHEAENRQDAHSEKQKYSSAVCVLFPVNIQDIHHIKNEDHPGNDTGNAEPEGKETAQVSYDSAGNIAQGGQSDIPGNPLFNVFHHIGERVFF